LGEAIAGKPTASFNLTDVGRVWQLISGPEARQRLTPARRRGIGRAKKDHARVIPPPGFSRVSRWSDIESGDRLEPRTAPHELADLARIRPEEENTKP
jgi:hypothetical protein